MEEAESEEERAVEVGLVAGVLEELVFADGVDETDHVALQTFWRFGCHLDGALKNSDGERGVRNGREPETEVVVWAEVGKAFDDLFEFGEP